MNLARRFTKFEKMKFLKLFGLLSLSILFLYSCKTSNQSASAMENIHRKWMLVEYKDFTKDELTKLEAYMDLTKNAEAPNQYGVKMGCNGMSFTAEFGKEKVKFSNAISTMMYCEGRMKLEEQFGKDLPKMNQYKIDGHFLTLTDGVTSMKLVAADWD